VSVIVNIGACQARRPKLGDLNAGDAFRLVKPDGKIDYHGIVVSHSSHNTTALVAEGTHGILKVYAFASHYEVDEINATITFGVVP
jgi:hypothetical protein